MTNEEFRDQLAIQLCTVLVRETVKYRNSFWGSFVSFNSYKESIASAPGVAWEIASMAAKERAECLSKTEQGVREEAI